VDLTDGVVHVEERDPTSAGAGVQARNPTGEPGQDSGTGLVELLDVAVGERAQERAQR
jgi:hypothetical protein